MSKLTKLATSSAGSDIQGFDNPFSNIAFKFADLGGGQAEADATNKQTTALKLIQLQSMIQKNQADIALKQKQIAVWDKVGQPAVTDKSTAGDVSQIVDSEEVGGRDAGVVNDGSDDISEVAGNADTQSAPSIPADTSSNSSLVNMMKGMQPVISPAGNMILKRPKAVKDYQGVAKHYDEARTFNYARRLADQSIIQSGKRKHDIAPEDYKTLVNDNIPQAEKYLYGRVLTQPDAKPQDSASTDDTGIKTAVQTAQEIAKGGNSSYQDGQTAVNPKTGKRLKFQGGQWVPLN